MGNWLLPESLADVLPAEARRIEEVRRELLDLYRTYGFELVAPPPVSYTHLVSETPAGAGGSGKVGSALRTLRQSKGWSLDEVSSRIKFSAKQIEALENEQWAELPTGCLLYTSRCV